MTHSSHPSGRKQHILLVHDSVIPTRCFSDLQDGLSSDSLEYQQVNSRQTLESALRTTWWDVIVCQSPLPRLEALDVLTLVHQIQADTQVIFVVNTPLELDNVVDLMRAGARGVVQYEDKNRLLSLVSQELVAQRANFYSTNQPVTQPELNERVIQLSQIIDSMQDALLSISLPDRQVIFASSGFEKIFGYPLQPFLANPDFYQQVVHPDDLEMTIEAMQTGLQEGFVELEHRIILPDGSLRWVHRRAWVNVDKDGRPTQVNDMARDITSYKRIQEDLKMANHKQQAILDSLPDLMFRVRADGTFLEFHGPAEKSAIPIEHLLGNKMSDFKDSPVVSAEFIQDIVELTAQSSSLNQSHIVEYTLPDHHHYEVRIFPITQSDELILLARDISERKAMETALRNSEERQHAILQGIPDLVFRVARDGTFLDYHAPDKDWLYVKPEDFLNKRISQTLPADLAHDLEEALHQCLDTQQIIQHEYPLTVNDVHHAFEARFIPIPNGEVMIVVRNVTERKLAEAKLRESEEKYRSLLESVDSVIAVFDKKGTVLYANEYAALPYGLKPEQMVGKAYEELFPPELAQSQLELIRSVIQSETGIVLETPTIVAGKELWYRTSVQPVRDSLGEVSAALVNATDITLSKTAEVALRQSAETLQQQKSFLEILLDISSRFITLPVNQLNRVIDATLEQIGNFLHAERLYIFDYDFKNKTTSNTYEWCAEGIEPQIMYLQNSSLDGLDDWVDAHQRGERLQVSDVYELDPDSRLRQILEPQGIRSLLAIPMMRGQECIGFVGIDTIKTNRLYNESDQQLLQIFAQLLVNVRSQTDMLKALEASEKRYRQIVETALEGIWMIDVEGKSLYVNQRMADMLGYPLEKVSQADIFTFMDAEARQQADLYLDRRRQGIKEQHDFRFKHQDGSDLWVIINTNPVLDENQQVVSVLGTFIDITERKQAEDALRRSEAYLRSLVNSEAAFNIRVNMHGSISYCNERYRRMFAWASSSLIGMAPLEVVHVDDHHKVYNAVKACLVDISNPVQIEIRKFNETGGLLWTLWEFSAITDSDGRVVEINCVGFDITKQKQAEADLQEANQLLELRIQQRTAELQEERNLLRTVIDVVPDFIYVKDRQHRMLLNNIAHARSLGRQDTLGKTDFELFPAPLAMKFYADEERLFENEQGIINTEECSIGQQGEEIWALTTKLPFYNVQGELSGLVGITRDITDMKEAERALRESEERYRTTIAAMSEGIVLQDRDGVIRLFNEAAERILGLSADQMMGRSSIDPRWHSIHEDGSPFPGEEHPAMYSLRTGEAQVNVVMGVHKPDGSLTWISINSQPLKRSLEESAYAVVATFYDITARKQAESALKDALVQEKELGELKSRFVSMASHEFRTPLAAILATTETLSFYRDKLNATQINERLERIRQQVLHMKDIMEDVLQLARMQAGRLTFEPTLGDLADLCLNIVEDFNHQEIYGGRIHYESSSPSVMLQYDTRLVRQIISNIVHNALKYSAVHQPVHIRLSEFETEVQLVVQDKGIGVPAEDIKRMFEPFHRAKNVGAISGTGLGLSITKQAVEIHGGTIKLDSQVGEGTTITVTLPKFVVQESGGD